MASSALIINSKSSLILFSLLVLLSIHQSCAKKAHLNFYLHEILAGPNATVMVSVQAPNATTFARGSIAVIDDMLRQGQDANSTLIGRAQGVVAAVGFDGSLESMLNLIFTTGKYNGSTLAVYGRVVMGATIERPIIGGTGIFKLATGYCIATPVYTTATTLIYQFDVDVWYKEIN